ncbi:MAG: methyltransferase domain-containing protein [Alphaproteobacteria bacterium]|nr:methyltransferase domain-containing protein [Alphaproteobacteria bacterium]
MPVWDPDVYAVYRAYRERPALDLLTALPRDLAPREIWDLGCGLGEQAALLAARHPEATVHGLDSSPQMLERAKGLRAPVDWILGDIAGFSPARPVDLLFTNAALQWVEDHPALFARLAQTLAPRGVLACQMPVVTDTAWRKTLGEVVRSGPWARRLDSVEGVQPSHNARDYYDWLAPTCPEIDIWTTTYLHALHGQDPIVDWTLGTTLRPYLDALDDASERAAFVQAWRRRLTLDYPRRADGVTLFPFTRMFLIARRG